MKLDPTEVLPALTGLPDPRAKRGIRLSFVHLLVIMVCSVIVGVKTLVEMAERAVRYRTLRTRSPRCRRTSCHHAGPSLCTF
ncbi:hypothetical protein CQ018_17400 [Arthrobacter sp. MYb227]|uniref:transposase family protein n=1 Tax=Arthrobacter sp. MYb227 TaxID=1848601 RepID=UPI000CFAE2A4|nr:hypothetical protein CQ018_17400 [Arthrobacter sp. MYb227]